MFAYDDEDLRLIVKGKLSHAVIPSSKKLRCHLSTVGRIALMMRKFEKAGSNSYKKSLQYVFDKGKAISQLRAIVGQELPVAFRLLNQVYLIRKFELDWEQFTDTDTGFLQSAMISLKSGNAEAECDRGTEYLYSLALKYLCRNSQTMNLMKLLNPYEVLNLLAASKDSAVKTELVWTLGYIIASLIMSPSEISVAGKDILDVKMTNNINALILSNSEICDESKAFLLSQINAIKSGYGTDEQQGGNEYLKSTTMINRQRETKNKKQLVVSKAVNTMRSSIKSQKCDDVQLKILNLASALKNRSRKSVVKKERQHFDTIEDESGDDRSMFRTTWAECLNLYQLACSSSGKLKASDKDVYLPSKLFGNHYFSTDHDASQHLYQLVINRMIAATFQRISRRQELNDAALDSLMKGIVDVKMLPEHILRGLQKWFIRSDKYKHFCNSIVDGILASYKHIEGLDGPDLLKEFYANIQDKVLEIKTENYWFFGTKTRTRKVRRETFDEVEVHGKIKKELERLRMDIVTALYNSACRNRKVMTKKKKVPTATLR